jgi:predicted PurR-regulated permease PerM
MTTSAVPRERVPVRTILTAIGLVLATMVAVLLVVRVERILVWLLVAGFFAVTLYPVVDLVERRMTRCRRSLATLLVFLVVFLVLAGLLTAFVVPLAREATQLSGQLPAMVGGIRDGRGPLGEMLARFHLLGWVQDHQDRIRDIGSRVGAWALGVLQGAGNALVAAVTVFVLAFLVVLEGPKLVDGTLALLDRTRAEHVRAVGQDCARTITGYISGNLLISAICGVLTYLVLRISGVPFAGLIALWVAVTDLIPLVGATLGGVVAAAAAFSQSVHVGIIVVVFFVVYQQLEGHLLQPLVYSRTVRLNPLAVVVSILLAAELAGVLGALLAIPVAGVVQIVIRDLWDHRRGRLKDAPTVGADRTPVNESAGARV